MKDVKSWSSELRPLIGITTNMGGEDYAVRQKYCEQVEKAGGAPVLLTPTDNKEVMAAQLEMLDALIFTGGGDHDPHWQGEEPSPLLGTVIPERDIHELTLCRMATERQMPMLGICRGMQTIAITMGGHVAQDLTLMGISTNHSQQEPKWQTTHSITISEDSTLYNIIHARETMVNSFHHQAVDKAGEKMRIVATSPDGVPEAIESAEGKSILGVQWHPEQLADEGLKLFSWLTKEAEIFRHAKRLHHDIITFDSHCDTPMFFSYDPENPLQTGVDFIGGDDKILYDLPKMQNGRIDAVNMVCYIPQKETPFGMSPREYADYVFDGIENICQQSGGKVRQARMVKDILENKRQGAHSIVLGIENGKALEGSLSNLKHFICRGVSYITLCHNGDNDICDSCRTEHTHGGLSPFGREVVKEMNRLGILIDLSHAGDDTIRDVLQLSEKPVVCTHSNCRELCPHPRNLTDDQMRLLASKGGVMQLTLYHGFIKPGDSASQESLSSGKEKSLLDAFLAHLDHAISVMGIDHVGIGTDFDGDGGVPGLANAAELLNLTMHLIRRGYTDEDIQKIWGGNFLALLD